MSTGPKTAEGIEISCRPLPNTGEDPRVYYCVHKWFAYHRIAAGRYCESEMSVVEAKIQTVEEIYRLV
jgi:hypothetical protein